jgi:tetratricopeptide (TPR) repeat protein
MGVVAASRRAAAEENDEESARVEEMKDLFELAQDAYAERDYEGAYVTFMAAYDLRPAVSLLYNAAVCREKQGELLDAMELFQRYLDESPGAGDRERVEARLRDLAERAL